MKNENRRRECHECVTFRKKKFICTGHINVVMQTISRGYNIKSPVSHLEFSAKKWKCKEEKHTLCAKNVYRLFFSHLFFFFYRHKTGFRYGTWSIVECVYKMNIYKFRLNFKYVNRFP